MKNAVNQLEHWNLPHTDTACASVQLMLDVSPAFVASHNVRSYLFARELATAKGLESDVDCDDELVFLDCILQTVVLRRRAQRRMERPDQPRVREMRPSRRRKGVLAQQALSRDAKVLHR